MRREIFVWISANIEKDFERRDVFPELRSGKSIWPATKNGRGHTVPRSTAEALLCDAREQRWVKRGVAGRGLTISYAALLKSLPRRLGLSHVANDELWRAYCADRNTALGAHVSELFGRLGIPVANYVSPCAQIIRFPSLCRVPPPKTAYQTQFERVAQVLHQNGYASSIEQARAALTHAVIKSHQPNTRT